METSAVHVEESAPVAANLLHPLRSRVLSLLREKPDSAAGIAERTGLPRQKINYHMRLLEEQGLLQLVETRRRRNMTERILQPTADAFLIGPEALGGLAPTPGSSPDMLSAQYLLALAARMILELGKVLRKALGQKKKVAVLGMHNHIRFADAARRKAFSEELVTLVSELVTRYHDESTEGGRDFELMAGVYPTLNPETSEPTHREKEKE